MNLVEVRDVYKSFKNKKVLNGINLDIREGESLAILGPNGAGKSTLVNLITQMTQPTSGSIKVNIEGNSKIEVGVQFQEGNWPSGITAKNMLKFYKSFLPKFDSKREKELKEVFELDEFINRPLEKLSGGQKQRFNAMLATLNNPKIIILDEFTTGLDMHLQFKIADYFRKIIKEDKQTMLIVSHNPLEVEELCQRLVIINEGIVWMDKKVEDVRKQYGSVKEMMELFFKGEIKSEQK